MEGERPLQLYTLAVNDQKFCSWQPILIIEVN